MFYIFFVTFQISSQVASGTDPVYGPTVLNSNDPDEVKIWSLESNCCLLTVMEKTRVDVIIMDDTAETLVVAEESRKIVSW